MSVVTRLALLETVAARLADGGVEDARRTAEWMIEEATGARRAALYASPHVPATPAERVRVEGFVRRRLAGEPIQYVLGHADFYGLRFAVSPAVLVPRPETEEVVEHALACLRTMEAPWILDVGTGSGVIAVALKRERPDAEVLAVDVSAEALAVAAGNAERLGAAVSFIQADALRPQFADEVPPTFDLVVSNPPYVPHAERPTLAPEVRDHEPEIALFVPDADPLRFYRVLAGHADRILRPGGWLVVETHADHGPAVCALCAASGFQNATLTQDLAGRDRIVSARRG